MLFNFLKASVLAATLVSAQTFTDCDPTKRGKSNTWSTPLS
jgi:hypothetical protein